MKTETYNIKTNMKIGQEIFENIPNEIRPGWAGLVLSRFNEHVKNIPNSIVELYSIIDSKERWKEAHEQLTKIRTFSLGNKNFNPEMYLPLAELVAKVTYNASGEPVPFDSDSGHFISSFALKTAEQLGDGRLKAEVESAILLFNHDTKLKENITTAKDFLLYKKIDDILWFDWDPINVNGIVPRDEYQGYVPEIFNLKKSGANRIEIANGLLKIGENMFISGTLERCLLIADKIIKAS